ncbi:hypothetical protein D3C85_1535430 [compost metagenome]
MESGIIFSVYENTCKFEKTLQHESTSRMEPNLLVSDRICHVGAYSVEHRNRAYPALCSKKASVPRGVIARMEESIGS